MDRPAVGSEARGFLVWLGLAWGHFGRDPGLLQSMIGFDLVFAHYPLLLPGYTIGKGETLNLENVNGSIDGTGRLDEMSWAGYQDGSRLVLGVLY